MQPIICLRITDRSSFNLAYLLSEETNEIFHCLSVHRFVNNRNYRLHSMDIDCAYKE
jgi:hypothetical protein